MAVQIIAGTVIPHRGARVGMAGGDLDVAQVDVGVEHGRDECDGACAGAAYTVLHLLRVERASGAGVLAAHGGLARRAAETELAQLASEGLVTQRAGLGGRWSLTESGRAAHAER